MGKIGEKDVWLNSPIKAFFLSDPNKMGEFTRGGVVFVHMRRSKWKERNGRLVRATD